MTGLEIIKASGTTAGEIADIISKPCPPIIPAECDKLSCRECWLVWLTTGEAACEPCEGIIAPREEAEKGAPESRAPLDWEPRFVSLCGVKVAGKRYSSGALAGYVGKKVLVKYTPETVTARNLDGDIIGALTLFQE